MNASSPCEKMGKQNAKLPPRNVRKEQVDVPSVPIDSQNFRNLTALVATVDYKKGYSEELQMLCHEGDDTGEL